MAENKKAVSLDELSHFKAKQDLFNANTYQKKGETDLTGAVRYDTAQVLTEEQKAQARLNIGVDLTGGGGTVEGAVRYDAEQSLDDDDKARARANIGTTDGTWESMPDKPFGETGLRFTQGDLSSANVKVSANVDGADVTWYKVAEPYSGSLNNAKLQFAVESEIIVGADSDFILTELESGSSYIIYVLNILEDNEVIGFEELGIPSLTIPEKGLYILDPTPIGTSLEYFLTPDYDVKQIEKKYLPDDLNVELPEGIVTTDKNGLIPASVLPSYVDDVIEAWFDEDELVGSGGLINPERGKIYVDVDTGNTYRWSGSTYVRLNPDEITFATTSDIDELFN